MFISILTCVLVVSLTVAHPLEDGIKNEPKCSKFDYEEKLLEKMIRMEMKMEKILDDVKGKEKDLTSIATDLSQRVGNVENNVIQFQSDVNQTVTRFEDKFQKSTETAAETSLPSFNFRLSSTKTFKPGDKIIFDTEVTSQGKGYDKSTGIFTAPYTGMYYFSVHVCNQNNKAVQYSIFHEGTQLTRSTQHDTNGVYSCSSVSAVVLVSKAERVWVQCIYESTLHTDGARWNAFTGVLLYKHML